MPSSKTLDLSQRLAMAASFMLMQQKLNHPQPIVMMDRVPDVLFSTKDNRLIRIEFGGFTPNQGSYLVFVRLFRHDTNNGSETKWFGGLIYMTHTNQPNFHQICPFGIKTVLDIPEITLEKVWDVYDQVPIAALQRVALGHHADPWGTIEFVRQHIDNRTITLLVRLNNDFSYIDLLRSAVATCFQHVSWNLERTEASISLPRIHSWTEDEMPSFLRNRAIQIENQVWPYIPEDED